MPNYGNLYDGSFQVGDLVEIVTSRTSSLREGEYHYVTGSIFRGVALSSSVPRDSGVDAIPQWQGTNVEIRKVNVSCGSKMYFKDWYRGTFECQK